MRPHATRRHRASSTARRFTRLFASLALVLLGLPALALQSPDATPPSPDAGPSAIPGSRRSENVRVITIRGGIDRWTSVSVRRRIEQAEAEGVDAIVIDLDTPGGEVGAVLEITEAIKATSVPYTLAWVHGDAISGGAITALACNDIVSTDPAKMGDAKVITMGLGGVAAPDGELLKKILPPLMSDVTESARQNGHDELFAQAIIVDGTPLWSVRDTETGRRYMVTEREYRAVFETDPPRSNPLFSISLSQQAAAPSSDTSPPRPENKPEPAESDDPDIAFEDRSEDRRFQPTTELLADIADDIDQGLDTATDRPEFTPALAGRFDGPIYVTDGSGPLLLDGQEMQRVALTEAIIQNQSELETYLGATKLTTRSMTWSEHVARFLDQWWIKGLLIVVMLVGFGIELLSPGLAAPGAIGLVALFLLLAPPLAVGMAGWWEVLALSAGLIMLLLEAFVLPGFGVFGILGFIAVMAGLVGTFIPDNGSLPGSGPGIGSIGGALSVVTLSIVTAIIVLWLVARQLDDIPLLSRLILKNADPDEGASLLSTLAQSTDEPQPGTTGEAISPLRPAGRVRIDGRSHDAIAERGYIEDGDRIVVTGKRGFSLVVTAHTGAPEPQPDAHEPHDQPDPPASEEQPQ